MVALDSGGLENYLLRFLTHQKDKIDATVYCKAGYIGELEQEYQKIGVKLKAFSFDYFNLLHFYNLYEDFKRNNYDSVCDFTGNIAAFPLLIAKTLKVNKRIVFYRGSENRFRKSVLKNFVNSFFNKLVRKVSTTVLANSKHGLIFFHPVISQNNDNFKVIYNGIDANLFLSSNVDLREKLNIPTDAYVVGHIGRFNPSKNHKTIMKVALNLCQNHENIYFILCGKGVDLNLKDLVHENSLNHRIKLLGMQRNIIEVLNTLDCFYFPSTTEGQPNALIEAMVSGVPFVASNIAPIKETVPTSYYEQLLNPFDEIAAQEKILSIRTKGIKRDQILKTEVSNLFEPNKWFNNFFTEL
ncbi:glycosyltransferase [Salinimicrobium flavum]|uniref:glycosyltransferase n=1 Tax=Salinimicrobium flavum TaxID=1737065 RepID=UPI0036D378A6